MATHQGVAGMARRRRRAAASGAELDKLTLASAYGSNAVHSVFHTQKEAARPRLHPPASFTLQHPLPDSLMPLGGSSGTAPMMPTLLPQLSGPGGSQGAASIAGCRAQLPPPPSTLTNLMSGSMSVAQQVLATIGETPSGRALFGIAGMHFSAASESVGTGGGAAVV